MRILIDSAIHDLRNKGNNAMLEGALKKFAKRWPEASLEVVTKAPHVLRFFYPETRPVLLTGNTDWSGNLSRAAALFNNSPRPIRGLVLEMKEEFDRRRLIQESGKDYARVNLLRRMQGANGQKPQYDSFDPTQDIEFRESVAAKIISGTDLYAAVGGHYMSDVSQANAIPILERLKVAKKLGVPAVMLGQGMGPIEDPALQAKSKEILPLLDLIAVREKVHAPKLLKQFGVEDSRIMITGDDAVELTYEARRDKLGTGIGLGIRMMFHTEINEDQFVEFKNVIFEVANLHNARLIAVPVSQHILEADNQWISQLMEGYSRKSIGWRKFESCREVIQRVGECRLVITGAYHTAVFALAQGIPAICVARSDDYANKLTGLADQFGEGCPVILLSEENWKDRLLETIKTTWESAEYFRPLLLKAAVRQIEDGNAAYERVFAIVESMKKNG